MGQDQIDPMKQAYQLINERLVNYLFEMIQNHGLNVSDLVVPVSFLQFNEIKQEDDEILYKLREIMKLVCEEMDLDEEQAYSVASSSLLDVKTFVAEVNDTVREMQQDYIEWHKKLSSK